MTKREYSSKEIQALIAQRGLKVTQQRLVILQFMLTRETHPSAEEIYRELVDQYPSLSLGTVYKTLDSLTSSGLLHKVFCVDGIKRYDVNLQPHAHLYCTTTHQIIDFEDSELQQIILAYLQDKNIQNFQIEGVQLQIQGTIQNLEKAVKIESSLNHVTF
jgi:Fur family peroxide stress response transcriptional regulator